MRFDRGGSGGCAGTVFLAVALPRFCVGGGVPTAPRFIIRRADGDIGPYIGPYIIKKEIGQNPCYDRVFLL